MKIKKLSNQSIFLLGALYVIITALIGYQFINQSKAYFVDVLKPNTVIKEVVKTETEEIEAEKSVQDKIVYYADIYGVDKDTALKVAECESGFNPKAENIEGSATGVYQWIRKSWKNNCEGDVYNADANIICFAQNFNKHPEWWSASKGCWGK